MNSAFSFVEQEIVDFGFIAIETQDANAILSQWELVDATDSDADSELTEANGAVSDARCVSVVLEAADCSDQAGSISLDDADNAVHNANLLEVARIALFENGRVYEEDEDEDDDGLDDELVPRYLSGKLGRQRMRKLGKRGYAKMNTSKKFPHQYMKPGCVQGKHGLGLNHTVF